MLPGFMKMNSKEYGIYLDYSDNCNISRNTINENIATGIYLRRCDDNVIKNNTINRNDLGIALDQSDYNNVSGNTLIDNNWCLYDL